MEQTDNASGLPFSIAVGGLVEGGEACVRLNKLKKYDWFSAPTTEAIDDLATAVIPFRVSTVWTAAKVAALRFSRLVGSSSP